MSGLLEKLLLQLGLIIVARLINGDKDTTELEAEIAATTDRDELEGIAVREAVNVVGVATNEETATLVGALVTAKNSDEIKAVINEPTNRKNLLTAIADAISGLFKALLGGD